MTFARNPSHAQDGILKFAAPFWGKPRWAALFVAIAREIQDLEDAAIAVIESRFLANATGVQLKILGAIVGVQDPGLGEDVFRLLIKTKIRVNRSNGSRKDLIEVLDLLGAAGVSYQPSFPAKVRVDLGAAPPIPLDIFTQILNATLSAGVGAFVVYDPVAYATAFSFSDNTNQAGSGQGWADGSAPGVPWAAVSQV